MSERRAWTGLERRWLLAIWDAILSGDESDAEPLDVRAAGLEGYHADLVRSTPWDIGLGLRATTWLLMLAPLVTLKRPAWFAALDRPTRARVLERLSASRWFLLRELPELHKLIATMGYCALPEVQRAVGVPCPEAGRPSWSRPPAHEDPRP